MSIYKIKLIEKVEVTYQVTANSEEEALEKARIGDAKFCDSIFLGLPDESFKLELLEQ